MKGYSSMHSTHEQQYIGQSSRVSEQPAHEFQSYLQKPCGTLDNQLFSADGSQQMQFPGKLSQSFNTPEGATSIGGHSGNSSFTVSYSATISPISHADPHTYPSFTSDNTNNLQVGETSYSSDFDTLKKKIKEIETLLLGPEPDISISNETYMYGGPSEISSTKEVSKQMITGVSDDDDLKEVLVSCARAVADNDLSSADSLMSRLGPMVSVTGNPVQRLGAYMLEGLVARLGSSATPYHKSIRCKEPTSSELLSYMHLLYEVCPYYKFGYMAANGAIAEAMKDENSFHIIDFQISEGSQWFTLIQAFSARPGGPPRIRITGVDDTTSAFYRGGGLDIVGERLSSLAESCRVPFKFNATTISNFDLDFNTLEIIPGEALAVNFAYMLHHMPDGNGEKIYQRDKILSSVKNLCPKVVTLIEQEANTNTCFIPRFLETFKYYMAVFESIDVMLPRDNQERIGAETHCLARDIVNLIACEGTDRVERHEILEKWRSRFVAAGFKPFPLNSYINATIKNLLKNYCEHYTLEEREGALYLGWMEQNLVATCAWS
ncbi:hypothetical protein DCAR_0519544 [Daucus carota subsp. sativus]|uniref:Uncharacterized protein n=1 Tax=Daucus carota subsp. sativus TaxID=79200 RepID=A0A164Y1J8_DAUCS|nr:PREDICTED: scarecrow-like protein 21 [Daucus carota subsp. sativus]WOH00186.1 hypothetical protein DCAR_0519544 [Daucus carota subsp. sativus]